MSSNRFNLMILEKPIEAIQQLNIAENEIAVYPNPIQDKTIRFELYGNLKDASNYEIRNTVGQLIISGTILSNHTIGVYTVQMPGNAASGTYLISVFDKSRASSTSKFIYK